MSPNVELTRSRPVRLAAELSHRDEADADHLFRTARVVVRLETQLQDDPDARETLLLAVNQILRFCPNVSLAGAIDELMVKACTELAEAIHGPGHVVELVPESRIHEVEAILNIGMEVQRDLPWSTVNSTGWLARVASSEGADVLPRGTIHHPNVLGALAAACLGVGQVFLRLIGRQVPVQPVEFSLWSCATSSLGEGLDGPKLPAMIDLHAFLIGCGAVANGWAYTLKRSPARGHIEAVDRQSLRSENIGPYVAVSRDDIGQPKAELMRAILGPSFQVTPRPEEFELFKIRLNYGLGVPELVINGLDNVVTRHSVQRLWPRTLIDMAAGGLTAQVIIKHSAGNGICLLEALKVPMEEKTYEQRTALATGLRPDRILQNPTRLVTQEDVDAAPPEHRAALDAARTRGQLICGRITDENLSADDSGEGFAPAVPFVTALAGIIAAATTIRWSMGSLEDQHIQFSFESLRSRVMTTRCATNCECSALAS